MNRFQIAESMGFKGEFRQWGCGSASFPESFKRRFNEGLICIEKQKGFQ